MRLPWRRRPRQWVAPADSDSWITVPFRLAETARISIYTIARQPDIPPHVRNWIAQWLDAYNGHLIFQMKQNYGPDIFPILDRITREVMPDTGGEQRPDGLTEESWEKWEGQFREEGK